MSEARFHSIITHYEDCLRTHKDGALAVNWKSAADASIRYDVMLGLVRETKMPVSLLDFGCGLGALKGHIARARYDHLNYSGLEISEQFAAGARAQVPDAEILCMDVLEDDSALGDFDYIVMNGIFTRREDLTVAEMFDYMRRLLRVLFKHARAGLAFNVMSKTVDWESDTLFHPDVGEVLSFIGRELAPHYVLRNDYGLHETTFYVYRDPVHISTMGDAR